MGKCAYDNKAKFDEAKEFASQNAYLDKEKQRVTVRVDMFGRETTVELDFTQVQKI